ncbi:MAG: hypothetical protein DRR16_18790 [Candidatus Parabeggiatoa sp. nov. 3]|nr:MAG: hypothetical protein DRR00_17975 [Gammaproteobacteria bacterium]RKZ64930.1 MAG: hypothetical protein DRQ99_14155 [Gammaproteobacteria bacterium]RKZ82832.1 MAG: hypothetical protein DRR16_18790 [Gammaproteobacteria bacterium]
MHALLTLSSAFFDLCRLRITPQELPDSKFLLKFTLVFYTLISGAISLIERSLPYALLSSLLDTALLVLLISSLLYFARYSARITQTLTALAGANCVLGILLFVPIFWLKFYQSDVGGLAILLLLGLILWNFVVSAHILRHALEVPFFIGVLLTGIISVLTFSVLNQVVPFSN